MLWVVVCGNNQCETFKMTHNVDIITIFLIDCFSSITMQSICITVGLIKLQCDVCVRLSPTVKKPYASINMKSVSIYPLFPSPSLTMHTLFLCVCASEYSACLCLVGLIIYFYYSVISRQHTRDPLTCRFWTYLKLKWQCSSVARPAHPPTNWHVRLCTDIYVAAGPGWWDKMDSILISHWNNDYDFFYLLAIHEMFHLMP